MEATARDLVVHVVSQHADALLRVARRYTSCAADAEDAYQRALEIFVRNAHRLDAVGAHKWLYVVVRHEALAVRRARSSLVAVEDETALDTLDDGRHVPSVEERSERFDELSRAAEALQRLKPQEVTALWLKAEGLSYDEIAERQGWTYTKVNRCITEGRRAFLRRYAGIEAGEECERWSPVISAIADGEATHQEVLDARPHLRNCPSCRASLAAAQRGGAAVAGLFPAPLALAGDRSGVLARLGEVAASLHDRAAGAALKAHAAGEAVASGKLAAVAASAVAIAGGGFAAERHLGEQPARADAGAPPPAVEASRVSAVAAPPAAPAPQPSGGDRTATARAARSAGPAPGRRDVGRADAEPPPGASFAPEAEPTAPLPPVARPPTRGDATIPPRHGAPAPGPGTSGSEPGGEFGLLAPPRSPSPARPRG